MIAALISEFIFSVFDLNLEAEEASEAKAGFICCLCRLCRLCLCFHLEVQFLQVIEEVGACPVAALTKPANASMRPGGPCAER